MKYTFTKTKSAEPVGKYTPTEIDARKAAADIRLTYANGGSFTVQSKVPLAGRGIRAYSTPGVYEVTEKALDKLRQTYTIAPDF